MAEINIQPAAPIRSLLVPLDGSHLAEAALPPALALARAFKSSVTLLHVLEEDAPAAIHGEPHLTREADAIAYLNGVARPFETAGVAISIHVHSNLERDVSGSIARHAEELGADLIVLANHGSGGLRGFLFGRVAQKVLQRGHRPVLAIPVDEGERSPPLDAPHRMAVLLNQSAEAEASIPLAVTIAQAFDASVHLILAVPTLGTLAAERSAAAILMPNAAKEVLNIEEREGRAYLDKIARRISAYAMNVTTSVVRGEPAVSAVQEVMRVGCNLLVMTTHARGGLSGSLSGSIGAKILARSNLPLLLVSAPDEHHSEIAV